MKINVCLQPDYRIRCPVAGCRHTYTRGKHSNGLSGHLENVHNFSINKYRIIPKQCEYCSCDVPDRSAYVRHLRLKHKRKVAPSIERIIHKCEMCKYSTSLRSNYLRHIGKHVSDKMKKDEDLKTKALPIEEPTLLCEKVDSINMSQMRPMSPLSIPGLGTRPNSLDLFDLPLAPLPPLNISSGAQCLTPLQLGPEEPAPLTLRLDSLEGPLSPVDPNAFETFLF